ncbi:hypothetical protein BCR35DRAFT_351152 [Leucosporidium creatinivorum]|uniref:F-box domain-containing protein n=1 Tax=Leucosporidium creatinivorum TaxID=106004 RepID=A0A1Y2FYE5_9BASI|nr:hypothetical protein BCR35DRAFT_351152 [Leucosporidium creatinivorum]
MTSCSASGYPPLLRLPQDIWLQILLEYELGYFDLLRLSGVNRAFNDLLQSPSLSSLLFRSALPSSPLPPNIRINLHPILSLSSLAITSSSNAKLYSFDEINPCDSTTHYPSQLSARLEKATSPPTSRLQLRGVGPRPSILESPEPGRPVSVEDVIQACAELFSSSFTAEELYDNDDLSDEGDAEELQATGKSYLEALEWGRDAVFWEGWREPLWVDEEGEVVLKALPLGS